MPCGLCYHFYLLYLNIFTCCQAQKCLQVIPNPFQKVATEFKNSLFSWIFYWLTDWLPPLLMPSDKRNSIMAIATGLISSLFNFVLSGDVPTAAAPMLGSWFYQSSALFTFVLLCTPFLSPLPRRWCQFAVRTLWLRCETWISAVLAGTLLMLFFAWNGSQMFEELKAKRSVMIHCVKATHPLLYQ